MGRNAITLLAVASAFLPLACTETKTPTEPVALVAPSPTPTQVAGPLGIVHITLMPLSAGFTRAPASLRSGHTFIVHVEVRETRGVGVVAQYDTLESPGLPYGSPDTESGIEELRIAAGSVGTTDVIVSASGNVPCSAGLTVFVKLRSDDGLTARVPSVFNCSTGYWPL